MHIYAFGSVCRGEVSTSSDVDLLAITDGFDERFNPRDYSIYSYARIQSLWREGNPFAWHLALESSIIFAGDGNDILRSLGPPGEYRRCVEDCEKFFALFECAEDSIASSPATIIFDMSAMFLAMRNLATCFSLGVLSRPVFSRDAPRRLGAYSISIEDSAFATFEAARLLCTRGVGAPISLASARQALMCSTQIREWMNRLREVTDAARV